jgi:hypothetical protein
MDVFVSVQLRDTSREEQFRRHTMDGCMGSITDEEGECKTSDGVPGEHRTSCLATVLNAFGS